MSRFMDDALERRRHDYVARALNVAPDVLDEFSYEIGADELGVVWRIMWEADAPPAVSTQGAKAFKGSLWSEIPPLHEREL